MNMSEKYCEHCKKRTTGSKRTKQVVLPVKGENISVETDLLICDICGNEMYDGDLEQILFEKAYSEYRKSKNIISPTMIIALRQKYGLTQRSLAALLGWGEITIHRYEKGSIPDEAHNLILKFIEDPVNMQRLFDEHKDRLNPRALQKLEATLIEIHGDKVRKRARILKSK
jgi:putative zinc finger/helix-turn-helix YgiT family protein